jgi:DnaJ-class molecular chaperone
MKQVLIAHYKDNKCPYCNGRGFFLIQQKPGTGIVHPDEVVECKFCAGLGEKLKAG